MYVHVHPISITSLAIHMISTHQLCSCFGSSHQTSICTLFAPCFVLKGVWPMTSFSQQVASSMFETIRKYSQTSASVPKDDTNGVFKLCICLKDFLKQNARDLVQDAADLPVLCSYSSDGTPIRTTMRITAALGKGTRRREGKATHEYLMQLAFYRSLDLGGDSKTAVVMTGPVPLTHGKSSNAIFACGRSFFKTLREDGHQGIAIHHYSFDRAGYESLLRLFKGLHATLAPTYGDAGNPGSATLLDLMEWVVGTPCALHDGHNALKWALHMYFKDPQLLKDIYIIFRSLRESYDLIVDHVHPWLLKIVTFVAEKELPHDEELRLVWTALNLDPEIVQTLVELKLVWDPANATLKVGRAWASHPDLMEKLSGALLSAWEFKLFTESRWMTIGLSSRIMVASILLGLKSLVSYIRRETPASDFHIHGFGRLEKPGASKFLVLASMVSYVPDAALQATMEDPRLALNIDHVKEVMYDELGWLQTIALPVWETLGKICGESAFTMRSQALSCAHKASAFFDFRVLSKVKQLPWTLTMGDKNANLDSLVSSATKPSDPVALKIYKLVKAGYSRQKLCLALDLLADCSWATNCTEQAHAQAAVVKKFHKELGAEMLMARSMISGFNRILPASTAEEKLEKKLLHELMSTNDKNPQYITGRQVYFSELVNLSNQWLKEARRAMPEQISKTIMKSYSKRFDKLPQERKNQLNTQASITRIQTSESLMEQRLHTKARLDLLQARRQAEEDQSRPHMNFKAAKLSAPDEVTLSALWNSPVYTVKYSISKSKEAMIAPDPADDEHLPLLTSQQRTQEEDQHIPPAWFKVMCRNRDYFETTALCIASGAEISFFKFMFAIQSPKMIIYWAPIEKCLEIDESSGSAADAVPAQEYHFTIQPDSFKVWHELPLQPDSHLFVLPHVQFCGDYLLTSHCALMDLDEFFDDIAPIQAPEAKKAKTTDTDAKPKRKSFSAADVAKYPWLVQKQPIEKTLYPVDFDEEEDPMPSSESQDVDWLDKPVPKQLSDEDLEKLFEALEDKRKEWAAGSTEDGKAPFRLSFCQGEWTLAHLGKPWDAVKGYASGKQIAQWCRKYHLPLSARYDNGLYGNDGCFLFAKAWVSKMTYFYNLWKSQDNENYSFTKDDLDGWSESVEFSSAAASWTKKQATARLAAFGRLSPRL